MRQVRHVIGGDGYGVYLLTLDIWIYGYIVWFRCDIKRWRVNLAGSIRSG